MDIEPKTLPDSTKKPQGTFLTGYSLLAISLVLFMLTNQLDEQEGTLSFFFLHYALALAFAIVLLFQKSIGILKSWRKEHLPKTILLLNLFLVSAYALNRELPVFNESTDWLCFYIVITSFVTLTYRLQSLPQWINAIRLIVLGSALILYIYLSIYAANFYIIGAMGALFFGIGLHIFIPLLLLIGTIVLIKNACTNTSSRGLVALGSSLCITVAIIFAVEWNSRISIIEKIANQSVLNAEADLPEWVTIAQSVQNDWITQRILKSKLVYTIANDDFQVDFLPTNTSWDEGKKHDPLVFLASLFTKCSLSDEVRVKILQAISDSRHRAQERLWSGDNLSTSYVVSDIDIYTDLRLAYTEKYVSIKNNKTSREWWGATQEAIYTFQLPEGSVVTSLSLWINGKEEKSILTSKQKANEAYKTIVGVERRDPSVVHWQEGNTISARIFPCTQDEERKFKIGFTSPLIVNDSKVSYQNITFRGPNPDKAKEATRIRFIGATEELKMPKGFEKNIRGEYFREGDYDPELTISFSARPIVSNHFSFDGFTYSISQYESEMEPSDFSTIFLDINNSWTNTDLDELKSILNKHDVYAFDGTDMVQLNANNWNMLTAKLLKQNFSLFPFHLVKDITSSLVISKGKGLSPHLKDFKESAFAQKTSLFFQENKQVKLYNLAGGMSTYVSTFRELRGLQVATGSVDQLKILLQAKQFPKTIESEERVILYDAQLAIQKSKTDSSIQHNTAPDHLARLFAYNHIMSSVGAQYFKDDFINDDLVKEATSAYVVSPVSSLIVLETQEDYERFGIKDSENSLQNASKQSSGAVPEPHEWALIIVFALFVLYVIAKKHRFNVQA